MIVFVTGASAGFGAAIARTFVKGGHRVIATARRKDRLLALSQELGDALLPVELDVPDEAAIKSAIAALPDAFRKSTYSSTMPAWRSAWNRRSRRAWTTGTT